jgi:hypothetical protein
LKGLNCGAITSRGVSEETIESKWCKLETSVQAMEQVGNTC